MKFGLVQVAKHPWHMPGSLSKSNDERMEKWGSVDHWLVYQDEFILAVNKPSGLRTIPDGYDSSLPFLSGMLEEQFGRVWVVHRLDKETSGILLLARNPDVHRHINGQFDRREIVKLYHALVAGRPPWQRKQIDLPLKVDGDRKHRTVVDELRGNPATSDVVVLAQHQSGALLAVRPKSGYTHQIRAHLSAVGFPILYDTLYRRPSHPPFPGTPTRLALHALEIEFNHPHTGIAQRLTAAYPPDFLRMLADLAE
jgi:tRNA pseudouridine32 synthase / 23S rRNA pseudouridine746 synthase